jgi:hypothetical protein
MLEIAPKSPQPFVFVIAQMEGIAKVGQRYGHISGGSNAIVFATN